MFLVSLYQINAEIINFTLGGQDGVILEVKLTFIVRGSVFAPDEWREGEQAESGGSGWQRAGSQDGSGGGTSERREQHQ